VGLVVFAPACAARPLRTLDAPPEAPRTGIPVDPVSSIPKPTDNAGAKEGVVTLRTPIATEAVMAIVHRLFEAFHGKSTTPLEGDLDDPVVDLREEKTYSRSSFISYMNSVRLKAPFDQLEVDQMYRAQDVEVWGRDELGVPGRPLRPANMAADDLLVRIPIAMPRVGADVLFGEEIRLLLRRQGARYLVRGYYEIVPK
jgi:hypothetical protein